MTSQISSHIEYVVPTDSIASFTLKLYFKNLVSLTGFNYDLMIIQKWVAFYRATL